MSRGRGGAEGEMKEEEEEEEKEEEERVLIYLGVCLRNHEKTKASEKKNKA